VIRRLFHALAGPSNGSDTSVPFAVTCPAGHVVRGLRQRRHQVVSCAVCGVDVFVLPRSPFPDRNDPRSDVRSRRSPWRRPLVAAALALLIVAGALAGLFVALTRRTTDTVDVEMQVLAAEQALSEGRLRRAVDEFAKARERLLERPDVLTASRLRTLTQQYRETSLVADLLSESLAEILFRPPALPKTNGRPSSRNGIPVPGKRTRSYSMRKSAATLSGSTTWTGTSEPATNRRGWKLVTWPCYTTSRSTSPGACYSAPGSAASPASKTASG